jgi:hypothetical protein
MLNAKNLLLALVASPTFFSQALTIQRRDPNPNFSYDDKTSKDCTWWVDYDGTQDCAQMLLDNWATLADFRRWVKQHLSFNLITKAY